MSASLRVNEFTSRTSVFSEVQLQYPRVSHRPMSPCGHVLHKFTFLTPPSRSYPDYGMVAQTKDGQILSLAWHFTTWMRIQFFLPKKCEKTKIPAKRSAEKYKSLSTPRRFAFSHFGSSDAAMKRTRWPTWLYLNLVGFHATQRSTKN